MEEKRISHGPMVGVRKSKSRKVQCVHVSRGQKA